ncbi:PLP-dependent cysteine synthase family protein [Pelagibacterium sediminicola]|uniref:PLP-dependent cysteine synthase family protein n=1 Tax=Pelagibacterium sediminicola TaxID=2248761 RepID=UPI001FE410F4|nr:pyridoxal-phosphate dependent enzyme [Pelagibacterium sediminicola]
MLENSVVENDRRLDKAWSQKAVRLLEAEGRRAADSHLRFMTLPGFPGIDIYFKDESTHPTGSLKHRLAHSLILYGVCNGIIGRNTVLVEASSGSTAVSEAYFARCLGLDFYAVLPRATSKSKIDAIIQHGGLCHFVDDPSDIYQEASTLAARKNGHFLNQFAYAERAVDWRGSNNIACSIMEQLSLERHPVPEWIVMSAGTGGTSATLGRYILYRGMPTKLCVPDPQYSAFFEGWRDADPSRTADRPSRIEGIGRPRVEPSFIPGVVDAMIKVPDAASIAACRVLSDMLSRTVGGSTGTNFIGVLWAASRMAAEGREGSIVSLICDSGERYHDTYFSDDWLAEQDIDISPAIEHIEAAIGSGRLSPDIFSPCGAAKRANLSPGP